MNIRQAKEEIKRTVAAYLEKDEEGNYLISERFCRPVLLMGAPGIGKTAIMQQIADELGINLVSYTITHHTRQSAIGLPVVRERDYDGKKVSVTEYTMSEILVSVYDKIEETKNDKGILFLDEINCVSETLLPTMLQFLQYKTFGTHKVPRSYVIVCAGNPPLYNRSAREFDMVTLDRVKKMDIEVDREVFLEYAEESRLHGAVKAFLDIRAEYFYRVRTDAEETYFVTARGWEDLSEILFAYERNNFDITVDTVSEYISDPEIAEAFHTYLTLYKKYHEEFAIGSILGGDLIEGSDDVRTAPFDERLSLLHLLFDALSNDYYTYSMDLKKQKALREEILSKKDFLSMDELDLEKEKFESAEDMRQDRIAAAGKHTENVFSFIERTFGDGQEMVLFLTMIGRDVYAKEYLSDIGSDAYAKHSKQLLLREQKAELDREIRLAIN
ncbi:MAG: AAA family ATPase [Lachnospiraceae bacterium]|nr:AAA family ATPase [Lachnospiraceae bacterium]